MSIRSLATTALAAALLTLAAGCNHGGGGDKNKTGNPAVDAALDALFANWRSGAAKIDPSLTTRDLRNVFAFPTDAEDLNLPISGTKRDEGSVRALDVALRVQGDPNSGAYTYTFTIDLAGGSFRFLEATTRREPLSILSVWAPPYGFDQLDAATNTGTAYVLVRTRTRRTIERTFSNQAPGGETLLDPSAALPAAHLEATEVQEFTLLVPLDLTMGPDGVEAKIRTTNVSGVRSYRRRSGGPNLTPLGLEGLTLRVDGQALDSSDPVLWFAVGNDWPHTPRFADGDPIALEATVTGGLQGAGVETEWSDYLNNTAISTDTHILLQKVLSVPNTDDLAPDLAVTGWSTESSEPEPNLGYEHGVNDASAFLGHNLKEWLGDFLHLTQSSYHGQFAVILH